MPDIVPAILRLLADLSTVQLVVGLAISASLVVILQDWRWNILFLLAQYVLAGLLLSTSVLFSLAIVKILVGSIATLILYWTARSVFVPLPSQHTEKNEPAPATAVTGSIGPMLRFLTILLGSLVIVTLQVRFPIPGVTNYLNAGAYWLFGMGLLMVMLTKEPFRMGLGILLFQGGFELFYTAIEPALVTIGLTGLVTLMTALLISYLMTARTMPWPEPAQLDFGSAFALKQAARFLARHTGRVSDPETEEPFP